MAFRDGCSSEGGILIISPYSNLLSHAKSEGMVSTEGSPSSFRGTVPVVKFGSPSRSPRARSPVGCKGLGAALPTEDLHESQRAKF